MLPQPRTAFGGCEVRRRSLLVCEPLRSRRSDLLHDARVDARVRGRAIETAGVAPGGRAWRASTRSRLMRCASGARRIRGDLRAEAAFAGSEPLPDADIYHLATIRTWLWRFRQRTAFRSCIRRPRSRRRGRPRTPAWRGLGRATCRGRRCEALTREFGSRPAEPDRRRRSLNQRGARYEVGRDVRSASKRPVSPRRRLARWFAPGRAGALPVRWLAVGARSAGCGRCSIGADSRRRACAP